MVNEKKLDNIKAELKEEKRRLHNELVQKNKWFFRLMDIMVALIVLMNFGALATTNSIVLKEEMQQGNEIKMKEVNPVTAELSGYEKHPEYKSMMTQIIFTSLMWFLLILFYIYHRTHVHTKYGLVILFAFLLYYFTVMGMDFFNDFGYWFSVKCY